MVFMLFPINSSHAEKTSITVFAASSMTSSYEHLAKHFERENPDKSINFLFL